MTREKPFSDKHKKEFRRFANYEDVPELMKNYLNLTKMKEKELVERHIQNVLDYKKTLKDERDIKHTDEWLLFHQQYLKDLEKTVKKEKKERKDKEIQTSLFIDEENNYIAEQVYDGKESKFCIYDTKTEEISYEYEIKVGENYLIPIKGEEIQKNAISLPSEAKEYTSVEKLDIQIKIFIKKWLDIPEDILKFALWNIKRSWVYDRFHTINYLRALGDTGEGKTRFLDTLGSLHYKGISTSGATTVSPIFRLIDKWKGTLIIDEADFQKSDESQEIIKIINQGYEKGKPVFRCSALDYDKIKVFDVYCPKLIATRGRFQDKAVESRCITHVMQATRRKDIPLNLNPSFFREALNIRNKLLMWRFKNYYAIDPEIIHRLDGDFEPRVKQIVVSFVSLFTTDKQKEEFNKYVKKYQIQLREDRRNSFDGKIVESIFRLWKKNDKKFDIKISPQDIVNEGHLTSYNNNNPLQPRALSSRLSILGFEKCKPEKVDGKTKRCIPLNQKHLEYLFKKYGFDEYEDLEVKKDEFGIDEIN